MNTECNIITRMCVLISDKFDQLVKKLDAEEQQRKVIEGTTSCVMTTFI